MNEGEHLPKSLKIQTLLNIKKGRLNRTDFFLIYLMFLSCVAFLFMVGLVSLPVLIMVLPTLYILISAVCKRLRDIGVSAWFIIPVILIKYAWEKMDIFFTEGVAVSAYLIIDVIFFSLIMLWPGAKGENKYGEYFEVFPNPLRKIIGQKIKFFS